MKTGLKRILGILVLLTVCLLLVGCKDDESYKAKQFNFTLNNIYYRMTDCYMQGVYPNFGNGSGSGTIASIHIVLNTLPQDKGNGDVFVGSYIVLTNHSQKTFSYVDAKVGTNNTDTAVVDFIAPAASNENLIHWFVQGNDITMVC